MKKFIYVLIFPLFFLNCSFDNKTGIWKNDNSITKKKENQFKDFEKLYTQDKKFESVIIPKNNLLINLDPVEKTFEWNEENYQLSNNSLNYFYKNLNKVTLKGKKLSSKNINDKFYYDGNNIIAYDSRGTLIIFSLGQNKIIYKFNFYKKNFEKIEKKLNLYIQNKVIYVSDNLGYLYALDYINDKIIWAKNFKIPFRSNLKIINNKIFLADQNNTIYVIDKLNGEKIKSFPTEEVVLKNNFINSISSNLKSIFYLNTYGSLYSINILDSKIEWFVNLNQSNAIQIGSLFNSHPIISHNKKLIISSNSHLYILDDSNGLITYKQSIDSLVKPIISSKFLFLITKKNLLVCIDIENGIVNYSININKSVANFLGSKEKTLSIKSLELINNELNVFLNNSFVVKLNTIGKINDIYKFKSKLKSPPIFVNESILYLNKKNQIIVVN